MAQRYSAWVFVRCNDLQKMEVRMYWFWYIMYASMPALLLPGMFGFFGEEGKKAADDFAAVMGVILVIIIIGFGMWWVYHIYLSGLL